MIHDRHGEVLVVKVDSETLCVCVCVCVCVCASVQAKVSSPTLMLLRRYGPRAWRRQVRGGRHAHVH